MIRAIMAAVADNGVIGRDNDLVWHLPADLRHFKKTTSGHYIAMGRKTFESLGKPLPSRTNIIITRNPNYRQEGAIVVHSLEAALRLAEKDGREKAFILGGGEIYSQAMPLANYMYITEVHSTFVGDTYFPEINGEVWKEIRREDHPEDEKNRYAYSFVEYARRGK